jgi:hypothetical protein
MFTNAMMMRVMADKYRRLAERQPGPKERDKYRAYARIYSEMAIRFEVQHALDGLPTMNLARKQAGSVH